MTKEQEALFWLLRVALGNESDMSKIPADVDWQEVFNLSSAQGVSCVAFEGIQKLHSLHSFRLPTELTLSWYARSEQAQKAAAKKIEVIKEFGEMMQPMKLAVLKGLDYAQYWPNPHWREFGDLDCFAVVCQPEDVDKVAAEKGCRYEEGDDKHSHLFYKNLMIENHHTFTTFVGAREARENEKELQRLFFSENPRPMKAVPFYSPNRSFTAVFLIAHAQNHFFGEGMSLRMILDWYFFLTKEGGNVDWQKANGVLERICSRRFAVVMTEFCVQYFGLNSKLQGAAGLSLAEGQCQDSVVHRLADYIFNGKQHDLSDRRLFSLIKRKLDNYIHMWRFRDLMRLPVYKGIWQTIAFNSFFNRHPKFE